jgi:GNAT superfamily N-acetyltransferase
MTQGDAPEWTIEPVHHSHDRTEFSCGNPSLDQFLRTLVTQYEKRRLGRTYVAVRPRETKVAGYYTLASSSVAFETLPASTSKKLPRHPIPVVLLGRLAVDEKWRGTGLGRRLLVDALERCLGLGERLGVHAIEVDAIDDEAKRFYKKYGFVSLGDNDRHLYLPLTTIERAFNIER